MEIISLGGVAMNELYHYGIKRRSGRYPYGSGDRPHQHDGRISGNYRIKNYSSPLARKVSSGVISVGVNIASMFIPGFGLAWNANVIRTQIKHNYDWKDYYKKEGQPEKLSDLKKKQNKTTVSEDLKEINQRTGLTKKGRVNNCVCCSVAMELRQRGYDVISRSRGSGVTRNEWFNMFENIKFKNPTIEKERGESRRNKINRSYNNLCNSIEKEGEGSRGCMLIQYEKGKSGHAFNWEVRNGRVQFMDSQSNSMDLDKIFSLADPNSYTYARLDNLKLKSDVTEFVMSNKKG